MRASRIVGVLGVVGDNDARNLIATLRSTGGQQTYVDTTAVEGHHYLYSVTALDRTWNQSLPIPTISVG